MEPNLGNGEGYATERLRAIDGYLPLGTELHEGDGPGSLIGPLADGAPDRAFHTRPLVSGAAGNENLQSQRFFLPNPLILNLFVPFRAVQDPCHGSPRRIRPQGTPHAKKEVPQTKSAPGRGESRHVRVLAPSQDVRT
jgi:hypothetical protein